MTGGASSPLSLLPWKGQATGEITGLFGNTTVSPITISFTSTQGILDVSAGLYYSFPPYISLTSSFSLQNGPASYDCKNNPSHPPLTLSADLSILYGTNPLSISTTLSYDKCGSSSSSSSSAGIWQARASHAGPLALGGSLTVTNLNITLQGGHVMPVSAANSNVTVVADFLNATTLTVDAMTLFENSNIPIRIVTNGPASDNVLVDPSSPVHQATVPVWLSDSAVDVSSVLVPTFNCSQPWVGQALVTLKLGTSTLPLNYSISYDYCTLQAPISSRSNILSVHMNTSYDGWQVDGLFLRDMVLDVSRVHGTCARLGGTGLQYWWDVTLSAKANIYDTTIPATIRSDGCSGDYTIALHDLSFTTGDNAVSFASANVDYRSTSLCGMTVTANLTLDWPLQKANLSLVDIPFNFTTCTRSRLEHISTPSIPLTVVDIPFISYSLYIRGDILSSAPPFLPSSYSPFTSNVTIQDTLAAYTSWSGYIEGPADHVFQHFRVDFNSFGVTKITPTYTSLWSPMVKLSSPSLRYAYDTRYPSFGNTTLSIHFTGTLRPVNVSVSAGYLSHGFGFLQTSDYGFSFPNNEAVTPLLLFPPIMGLNDSSSTFVNYTAITHIQSEANGTTTTNASLHETVTLPNNPNITYPGDWKFVNGSLGGVSWGWTNPFLSPLDSSPTRASHIVTVPAWSDSFYERSTWSSAPDMVQPPQLSSPSFPSARLGRVPVSWAAFGRYPGTWNISGLALSSPQLQIMGFYRHCTVGIAGENSSLATCANQFSVTPTRYTQLTASLLGSTNPFGTRHGDFDFEISATTPYSFSGLTFSDATSILAVVDVSSLFGTLSAIVQVVNKGGFPSSPFLSWASEFSLDAGRDPSSCASLRGRALFDFILDDPIDSYRFGGLAQMFPCAKVDGALFMSVSTSYNQSFTLRGLQLDNLRINMEAHFHVPIVNGPGRVVWSGTFQATTAFLGTVTPVTITFSSETGISSFTLDYAYGNVDAGNNPVASSTNQLSIVFGLPYQQSVNCSTTSSSSSTLLSATAKVAVYLIEPASVVSFQAPIVIDVCQAAKDMSSSCAEGGALSPFSFNTTVNNFALYDLNFTSATLLFSGSLSCSSALGYEMTVSGRMDDYYGMVGVTSVMVKDGHVILPDLGLSLSYRDPMHYLSFSGDFTASPNCSMPLVGSGSVTIYSVSNVSSPILFQRNQNTRQNISAIIPMNFSFDRCVSTPGQVAFSASETSTRSLLVENVPSTVMSTTLVGKVASLPTPAQYIAGRWSGTLTVMHTSFYDPDINAPPVTSCTITPAGYPITVDFSNFFPHTGSSSTSGGGGDDDGDGFLYNPHVLSVDEPWWGLPGFYNRSRMLVKDAITSMYNSSR
eukprot:TRINITY_DN2693_c0_g1_i2.p1 TRINITY_DN2693_c0_g1~~TRINITY_DN2693_c0_g1_i2.p1  ORF type:complete len:1409 (-),score=315.07 TRINITY_DN2693_c0_g1_i2:15-4106(-)